MRNSNYYISKALLAILFTGLLISFASSTVTAAGNCDDDAIRCNDDDACTTDTCDEGTGVCGHTAIVCNDNNNCTVDACNTATGCVFTTKNCDDGNICTTDSCVPIIPNGCVHNPNTLSCDDNNACTTGDKCKNAVCAGTQKNCDDNNTCTIDSCDTVSGNCVRVQTCPMCDGQSNGSACTDDNACTVGDACLNGACVGTAMTCNDNNVCTTDTCDTLNGCVFTINNTLPCSDKNSCTDGDYCLNGACRSGVVRNCDDGNICTDDKMLPIIAACCVHVSNTKSCNDNNACTSSDKCANFVCAGTSKTCEDYDSCTTNSCDPASGSCVYTPVPDCICTGKPDGSPCTDGNACTIDSCVNQVCVSTPRTCNDNNVCTTDTCNTATGCMFTNNTLSCSDNNTCTVGDVCLNGVCQPGPLKNCDDGNVCTTDSRVPVLPGCCVYGVNTLLCNDSNVCTTGDVCANKVCTGTPIADGTACNDGSACTENDACSGGVCGGAPIVCPVGECDPVSGCPVSTPPTGSIVINNGAVFTNTTAVTLTLSATDSDGSVTEMQFSNDGSTWSTPEPYATSKNWTLTTGDGTKTVFANFKDNADNWMILPCSSTITLDTTSPVVTITSPAVGNTSNTTPTLTYTVSDGTIVVKVDGVAATKVSGDNLDVLTFGSHTVRVESTDAANNTGYAEVTFTVIDPSLIGLWHMDGDWTDTSGNGINGTPYSGATFSTTARVGSQAGSFDGLNDYVSAGSGIVSNVSNTFTIVFWANPAASRNVTSESNSGTPGISGQRYAVAPQNGGNTDSGAGVSIGNNGISVFEHGSSYLPSLLVHNTTLSGWNHVAVVYQNKQPKLYVNGQFVKAGLKSQRANVHPSTLFGNISTYGP
ncbi:MAG: hypothetical protein M0R70_01630 [Nitrospirae bacterium]|nr:hypothetical protein [Nitrospirota bacterium]